MRNTERALSKAMTEATYMTCKAGEPTSTAKRLALRAFNRAERRYGKAFALDAIEAFYADVCADEEEAFFQFELRWVDED